MYTVTHDNMPSHGDGFYISYVFSDNFFEPNYYNLTVEGYSYSRFDNVHDAWIMLLCCLPFHWFYYDHEDFING